MWRGGRPLSRLALQIGPMHGPACMMSPSRRRWLKRIWIALSLVIFAATCAERAKPWLKNFARALDAQPAPARHSAPAHHVPPSPSLRIASWNLQFLDVGARGHEHRTDSDY